MRRFCFSLAAAIVLVASGIRAQEVPAPLTSKPVKLMTLSAERAVLQRQFFGRVTARQTVDLAFQVPGQLEVLSAEEGTSKPQGALISRLDLSGYERAVAQAEANFAKAQRDLQRLESLRGQAVTAVQVNDAETRLLLAEIALESASEDLDRATLRAPFDALIARRLVANFQTVSAGTPIVRLHDVSELRVDVQVPEVLFRQAGSGDAISFSAQFPSEDTRHSLVLREFETETSSLGQTYTITLGFLESPGAFVFPGASVTVYARAEEQNAEGTILPEGALVFDASGDPAVMVYDEGIVRRTQVSVELLEDGRLNMTQGPAKGTRIVMTGASQLRDGQAVRPYTRIGE